jgi:site-specific DNA recombinase
MTARELMATTTRPLRAALYARFSTDLQNDASVADQFRHCRSLAEKMGATIVAEFQDAGISGTYMVNRPGVQALMALVERRGCDVVIAEHTDRLSRSFEGGTIFEDFRSAGVRYVTVNQGEVTITHQGASMLVSMLTIEEGAKKTRRGIEGVVLSGRAHDPVPYGYRAVLQYDAKGDRVRGLRAIDPDKAEVVRRIYREFAQGISPLAIASGLNAEGIPGPRGGAWQRSTIAGFRKRGHGILRNDLYRGVRIWGKLATVKDRRTGRRRVRLAEGEPLRLPVPELRIIDDDLWATVQARLDAYSVATGGQDSGQRRPRHLLSGLIRCGCCGSRMVLAGSGDSLRCSLRAERGAQACTNNRGPGYGILERRVLESVQANLLHPDVVAEAAAEYRRAMAAERRAAARERAHAEGELAEANRRRGRLIQQVEEGAPWSAVAARHKELSERIAALERTVENGGGSQVVEFHPAAAGMFRRMFADLKAITAPGADRNDQAARDAVRQLISEIRFLPGEAKGVYELEIVAELAPLLQPSPGVGLVRAAEARSCSNRSHYEAGRVKLRG